jgi:hypothetical protein
MIDAAAAFSNGQVYVALSRCTSLDGIVLLSKIAPSAIHSNENVIKGQQSLTCKGSLQERFAGARQLFTQQLLEEIFSFGEINNTVEQLAFQISHYQDKLNRGAKDWIGNFKQHLSADREIGLKFIRHIIHLLKEESVIEKNTALQKRISDAAVHFIPKLEKHMQQLKSHPLITEHKEVAASINKNLNDFALGLFNSNFYLQYCKHPFSVTGFLRHKLKYVLPRFTISCYASETKSSNTNLSNPELFETLKRWRNLVCSETREAVYMVANHTSLQEISAYLPFTKKELMQISGFGKAKAEKYGDDILEAVQSYCERHGLESRIHEKVLIQRKEKKAKPTELKPDSKSISFEMHKAGKDIAAIAKERNFAFTTIEGHLLFYVARGEIGVDELVSKEKQKLITGAVAQYGSQNLKTLSDNLPINISYGEIRMVLAANKKTEL